MSGLDGPRLTYGGADGQPTRKRQGPPVFTLVLLVAAVTLAIVVVRLTLYGGDLVWSAGPVTTPGASAASTTSTSGPEASTSVSATPGPSSVPVGDDAATSTTVPIGASETATQFVSAWFDRDPKTRKAALQQVATTRLVNQLAETDPAKIPSTAPETTPTPVNVSEFAAEFVQPVGDGLSLRLTLVADPVSDAGWLVDSVTPVS